MERLDEIEALARKLSTGELQLSDPRKQVVVSREAIEAAAKKLLDARYSGSQKLAYDAVYEVERELENWASVPTRHTKTCANCTLNGHTEESCPRERNGSPEESR